MMSGIRVACFWAASSLSRLMESSLFGVSASGPPTFGVVAVLFLLVAACAADVPAARDEWTRGTRRGRSS
jgi:hypothetical protein